MNVNLRAARIASGMTQMQVADKAGMTERVYQNYEYGKRAPGAAAAIRLADALHIKSLAEFKRIFGADTPTPTE